ncbi:MAG: DUF3006 domain-containing protein [Limnochordia bacterium]|nr:DUF3006 domain-containing protein [Limnochordia bacterium]
MKQSMPFLLVFCAFLGILLLPRADTSSPAENCQFYTVDRIEADLALLLWAEDETKHLVISTDQIPGVYEGAVVELSFKLRPDIEGQRRRKASELLRGLLTF